MRRSRDDIQGAINRLRVEHQIPLAEVAELGFLLGGELVRPRVDVLLRWGQAGKAGCHLDIVWCRRKLTWVTSAAAIDRFARALAARAAPALTEGGAA